MLVGKIKIDIPKLKKLLKKLPQILVARASLFALVVLLFDILIGALVFYQYSFLPQKRAIVLIKKPLEIQETALLEIIQETEEKEKRFQEADSKVYPDLFRSQQAIAPPKPLQPEELTE